MPITFELRENGHVIYYKLVDPWALDEYVRLAPQEKAVWDAATHPIHHLVNALETKNMPSGVFKTRTAPIFTHPQRGYLAVVETALETQLFAEALTKTARYDRAKFFSTEAQAWDFLHKIIENE
jgi:hypothetical protein